MHSVSVAHFLLLGGLSLLLGLAAQTPSSASSSGPAPALPEALPSPSLHHLYRLSPRLLSGASPDDEEAFAELRRLGVSTIVSVDGARPNVEAARKHGLRYVHLPVGYDGISPTRAAQLLKAAQTAPGALYVHCHHGRHRGPSAAALLGRFSAGWSTNQAIAWLQQAGTSPDYPGLYRTVAQGRPPDDAALASVSPLPEIATTSTRVDAMVAMDNHLEHLKAAQKTGWKDIPGHPDLQPRHEATLLWEQFRELQRPSAIPPATEAFRSHTAEPEQAANALRSALSPPTPDLRQADDALQRISQSCRACHEALRN